MCPYRIAKPSDGNAAAVAPQAPPSYAYTLLPIKISLINRHHALYLCLKFDTCEPMKNRNRTGELANQLSAININCEIICFFDEVIDILGIYNFL
jgi:hypothetical protein